MSLVHELSRIERTLWSNDVEIYRRTLLPERRDHLSRVDLQDMRALALAPDVALLHYAATARWNYRKEAEKALCATLYVKRDGAWRVAFHQQTSA